ncbi:hypothetical protein [Cyclobacterium jeungdonense]|uniref:Tetratricopeptide repeat protein n=1 Tax=Cyclobacterium jeungdonense TaxID=708087 RepID=A0ABT8C8Q6_9BACT|nr:hypothetical protein [Cyclobacterium jeungdonense]MDN3688409.1 hypothetical protein [Cyclobacterium jeungdonense]
MNSQEFLSLLQKMEQLTQEDFNTARKLQEDFPYFLIPKIVCARYEWDQSAESATPQLHWAAVLSPNRKRLKGLLTGTVSLPLPFTTDDPRLPEPEEKKEVDVQPSVDKEESVANDPVPADSPSSSSRPNRDEILRRLEENLKKIKNNDSNQLGKGAFEKKKEDENPSNSEKEGGDLIDHIAQKEQRRLNDRRIKEQMELISNFQEKPIRLPKEQMDEQQDLPDLSEKSTHLNDNMLSESFAKLLVKQNKKPEAIEIYRKLILKFPGKKTYFADQIEKLKA